MLGGTTIIPQEEREESGKKFTFQSNVQYGSKRTISKLIETWEKENWQVLSGNADDYVTMFYPKQPADRPEEEGVPSNAEMDNINEKFARSILQEVNKIGAFLSLQDWSQPLDFACAYDDGTVFLAASCPFVEQIGNLNSAEWINNLSQIIYETIPATQPDSKVTQQDIMTAAMQGETKNTSEMTLYRMDFSWSGDKYAVVYGFDTKTFYLTIDEQAASDKQEEQYAELCRKLEEKIAVSHKLLAEKMGLPKTIFSCNSDGYKSRMVHESDAAGERYNLSVERESFGNVVAFIKGTIGSYVLPFEL
jgi:hypothetical protein